MADAKISALPSATPQSGDQFPFVRAGVTSRASYFDAGSWVPVLSRGTTNPTVTAYDDQSGRYIRMGNMVFAFWNIDYTGISAAGSGSNQITGLPFAVANNVSFVQGGGNVSLNDAFSADIHICRPVPGQSFLRFSAAGPTQADYAADYQSTGRRFLSGFIVYEAA